MGIDSRCLGLLAQPFSRPSQGRTLFLGLASLALAFLLLMISGTHFNLQDPASQNAGQFQMMLRGCQTSLSGRNHADRRQPSEIIKNRITFPEPHLSEM